MSLYKEYMNSNVSRTTFNLLVASNLPGVGKGTLRQIAADPEFYRTPKESLGELHPSLREFSKKSSRLDSAEAKAENQLEQADRLGVSIIGHWDSAYPPLLRASASSPALLWCKGNVDALKLPTAAVIGTRQPTEIGKITADRVAAALAERGVCIVSGLALGVDTIAHEACVRSQKPTVAVLAGGIEAISPKRNAQLASDIAESNGCLVSEFPIGMPTLPVNFVTRDATQAAFSSVVVLIQSDKTGGSMHASRAIIKMRRRLVVAVPVQRDVDAHEAKIGGNLALLSGAFIGDARMKFPPDASNLIMPLNGREDYLSLVEHIKDVWFKYQPKRPSIGAE